MSNLDASSVLRCILKKEKEKPVLAHHPWIFSGAIDQIDEAAKAGDVVSVESSAGKFLGLGHFNPNSQIAVRMLAFEKTEINAAFFQSRIQKAMELRKPLILSSTHACRLVHAEGDFLPGLVADLYGDYLAVQIHTAGMDRWKGEIIEIFRRLFPLKGIYDKSEPEIRKLEHLENQGKVLWGEEPPEFVEILENGIRLAVDLKGGQKTGFFLDQRDNRDLVRRYAQGRKTLNCFSYSGAFSVYAARGGAVSTVSIDSSPAALKTAEKNFALNQMDASQHRLLHTDVFQYLRQGDEKFDFIILDPPALIKHKSHTDAGARAYKDANLFALKRLSAGGLLLTCSCSSHMTPDLFQKILFAAAKDAGCDLRILAKTGHAADHPVNIYHPEGEYLKAFLCTAG